jgi:hypothetical protein
MKYFLGKSYAALTITSAGVAGLRSEYTNIRYYVRVTVRP